MAGFDEKILVNKHRKSRRREVYEILFVIQLEPVRLVLPFDWSTWSQGNLHFFQLDREFFCLLPSLARLYSAAASPSERLRSDGSLAISNNGGLGNEIVIKCLQCNDSNQGTWKKIIRNHNIS